MSSHQPGHWSGRDVLASVKELSGKTIERARRRRHLTQAAFAREIGLSVRWLRELEGGNPASTLDDHLLCSQWLDIPLGQIVFPLLYLSRGLTYPFLLAGFDTVELEGRFVDLINDRNTQIVRNFMGQDARRTLGND